MEEVVNSEQEVQKPKKKKKGVSVFKIIGETLFWIFIGVFVLRFVSDGIDRHTNYSFALFGVRESVIVSESMSRPNESNTYLTEDMKQIQKYDIIVTRDYKSYESIKLYDVLTYISDNGLICHRVVALYEDEGNQYVVTRGDANNIDDDPVNYKLVRGKVVNVIPKIGQVSLFLQSPYFMIALFSSLFFIFLGTFIGDIDKERKKRKAEKENDLPKATE